jgi:Bacterial mobilisation protein (MobC)
MESQLPNEISLAKPAKDSRRTNVRFSESEYDRIREESRIIGESIPSLLKQAYFKRKPVTVLLDATDRRAVFAELRRIGNNANQIAKRVNTGFFEDWHPEFQIVASHLVMLERYLVGKYGVR